MELNSASLEGPFARHEIGRPHVGRHDNVVSLNIVPAEKPIWPRPTPQTSTKDMQRRLGAAIRLRRRVVDITLADLAGACGVSFQQVQKYESGACSISAAQLWNIAGALEVPIAHLYDCAAATAAA